MGKVSIVLGGASVHADEVSDGAATAPVTLMTLGSPLEPQMRKLDLNQRLQQPWRDSTADLTHDNDFSWFISNCMSRVDSHIRAAGNDGLHVRQRTRHKFSRRRPASRKISITFQPEVESGHIRWPSWDWKPGKGFEESRFWAARASAENERTIQPNCHPADQYNRAHPKEPPYSPGVTAKWRPIMPRWNLERDAFGNPRYC